MKALGGRKFVGFVLSLVAYTVVCLLNKVDPTVGIMGLFTAFAGANAAEKFAKPPATP
jgi:hypothetical protein